MQLVAFTANNPESALAQVHERLGPDAVIVSVRQKRSAGFSWLWNSRKIEVMAGVPGIPAADAVVTEPANQSSIPVSQESVAQFSRSQRERGGASGIRSNEETIPTQGEPRPEKMDAHRNKEPSSAGTSFRASQADRQAGPARVHPPIAHMALQRSAPGPFTGRWRSIAWLESHGLLPAFARQLEEKADVLYGHKRLPTIQAEWSAVTDLIVCHWLPARQAVSGTGRPHLFIGPPGSGKTTVLCKWMSSAVLFQQLRVRVWRLDGYHANSSDFLTLHCEATGVPVERFWEKPDEEADLQFVDLPGVDARNESAMSALSDQLSALPNPHVHLVLNAAYESSILLEQFRAFECFGPEDLIFTHLDEETRRVKLWNFVLGTKCPISFLGGGQKVPGDFSRAEPSLLFPQKSN